MNNEMLNTIDDAALETVSGGGIGATLGGLVDEALKGVGEVVGGVFGLFGSVLTGLGDFISKIGKAF